MTTRHSTSKGCPGSPRRDATEQSKAKLSPWTLGGIASAQADRPRTARCKATREGRAKALSAGQCDESASCRAAGAVVTLAPPVRGHVLSFKQTNKEVRASKYSPHGRTTPTGILSHPPGRRSGASGGCAASTDHVKRGNRRITLWPSPSDSTKASGATVEYHN